MIKEAKIVLNSTYSSKERSSFCLIARFFGEHIMATGQKKRKMNEKRL